MNKKMLCGILTTAVLTGTCPAAAFAETTLTKSLDFRTMTEDASGDGWEWDATSQRLTLEDFRATVPSGKLEEKAAIYLPEESSIEVNGENNYLEVNSYRCDAIYCEGDLDIYGDGIFEIMTKSSSASVIYVVNGPLSISDEVELKTDPEGYVIFVEKAKGNRPIITISDDAKVTFPEEEANDRIVTITHKSSVTPSDNWINYSEEYDDWDERIVLVEKKASTSTDKTDKTEEKDDAATAPEVPVKSEYQITIGSPAIVKDGEVSYTADVSPYLKNGYTMLPLRALLEVSDPKQEVKWSAEQKAAYTFVNEKFVLIKPGQDTYKKATENIKLSTPAETANGRLFVSLRDWMSIMEIDGSQLSWNPETKTVTLKY